MTDRTFDNKVKQLMDLQAQAEQIEKQMEALKDDIKAEMVFRNVDEIDTKKYTAKWATIVSNRFDSSAFKKAYGLLYTQFTKASESKRFTFKAVA